MRLAVGKHNKPSKIVVRGIDWMSQMQGKGRFLGNNSENLTQSIGLHHTALILVSSKLRGTSK